MQGHGGHGSIVKEEGAILDAETCVLRGPTFDGDLRHRVHVECAVSTEGPQLDDITLP